VNHDNFNAHVDAADFAGVDNGATTLEWQNKIGKLHLALSR